MASSYANMPSANSVLLVEGQDDKHVIWQLCGRDAAKFSVVRSENDMWVTLPHQQITFQIVEQGNRSELLKAIRQIVTTAQYRTIGILVDADNDVGKCWEDLRNAFLRTDIQLPDAPAPDGMIISEQPGQPRIGIWIMPDNVSSGEIEDFVLKMMPSNDPVWSSSQSYINGIPSTARKFDAEKTDKAKLYAWLATRKEPSRMGAAIGAKNLTVSGPLAQIFLNWLIKLFS